MMRNWLKRYGSLLLTAFILGAAVIVLVMPPESEVAPPTPLPIQDDGDEAAPTPTLVPATPRPDQLEPVLAMESINQPGMLVRQPDPYTIFPTRERIAIDQYTVQKGDTLGGIAAAFELDPTTLFWGNPGTLTNVHLLSVGMDLNILPVDGALYIGDGKLTVAEIAAQYEVDPFDILNSPYNSLYALMPEDVVPKGERVIVPGGEGDDTNWVWNPEINVSGGSSADAEYSRVRFSPSDPGTCGWQDVTPGRGVFSNPIPYGGYVITNWFNPWHSGIDLAGSTGASIQAADTGKVIFAGWSNSGYGNLVVLAHGSTWMTYYAHLDSVSVGCGQIVSAGGEVGKMGTTGNSGGPHLHFEIRYHGTPDNPSIHIAF